MPRAKMSSKILDPLAAVIAARMDGTRQLRDELSTVDLRFADRLYGEPLVINTAGHYLDIACKRITALHWMRGRPKAFVSRQQTMHRLLTHPNLPSVNSARKRAQLSVVS